MTNKDNLKKIKKITEEFFKKTTFDVEIDIDIAEESISSEEGEVQRKIVSIGLETEDPKFLIGQNGAVLFEIQSLLKKVLSKTFEETVFINLDINDYKKRRTESLKEMARWMAEDVALTKKEKILDPMPAYIRKIIHTELAGRDDVETESTGEADERRVLIRPKTSAS